MKRGDLVTVAPAGDFGKPRPALVIQSDSFDAEATFTVAVLLLSSTLIDAPLIRVTVEPNAENGLRSSSQVMIDKILSVRRDKIGHVFGRMDDLTMVEINSALAVFLGFT